MGGRGRARIENKREHNRVVQYRVVQNRVVQNRVVQIMHAVNSEWSHQVTFIDTNFGPNKSWYLMPSSAENTGPAPFDAAPPDGSVNL